MNSGSMNLDKELRISDEVQKRLPQILIDYLWTLALRNREKQLFELKIAELGGRSIQIVNHIDDLGEDEGVHRIFGIEPVDCVIGIIQDQSQYRMVCIEVSRETEDGRLELGSRLIS